MRSVMFQSAVRIAVWLKVNRLWAEIKATEVSIRRADRCLVEELDWLTAGYPFTSFNPPCGSLFG